MVIGVGAPAGLPAKEVVGTAAAPEEVVGVSLEEPTEEVVWIAGDLLEATGESSEMGDRGWPHRRRARAMRQMLSAGLVKVRSTPETEQLGLAGLIRAVMGETIPSSSGVNEIIGGSDEDYAINAWFEERDEQFWFAPDLLEPVAEG